MVFENKLEIGIGAYTPAEIAKILRLPVDKVRRWIKDYWDGKLGEAYALKYSWKTDGSRAVGFRTLIEFYVMMQLAEAGVRPNRVLQAHQELSNWYDNAFPFALKEVLENIKTDAKHIYFHKDGDTIALDGTRQLNMDFIQVFFTRLDFDEQHLASRFWPLGRDKSIVIDPERKLGHPVINDSNIYPETLQQHRLSGDPVPYIAYIYDLTEQQVQDALEYCEAA